MAAQAVGVTCRLFGSEAARNQNRSQKHNAYKDVHERNPLEASKVGGTIQDDELLDGSQLCLPAIAISRLRN
jgi:hypothetical protein